MARISDKALKTILNDNDEILILDSQVTSNKSKRMNLTGLYNWFKVKLQNGIQIGKNALLPTSMQSAISYNSGKGNNISYNTNGMKFVIVSLTNQMSGNNNQSVNFGLSHTESQYLCACSTVSCVRLTLKVLVQIVKSGAVEEKASFDIGCIYDLSNNSIISSNSYNLISSRSQQGFLSAFSDVIMQNISLSGTFFSLVLVLRGLDAVAENWNISGIKSNYFLGANIKLTADAEMLEMFC